jgi:uncharacterized membrane protein
MSPVIVYMLVVALGLIVAVAMVEISEGRRHDRRDDYAEFEAWKRARRVTGRIDR